MVINNLGYYTDNLGWGANWNDRISSYQVFNQTSNGRTCLVQDANFNYSDAHRNETSQGNATINLSSAQNDQATS